MVALKRAGVPNGGQTRLSPSLDNALEAKHNGGNLVHGGGGPDPAHVAADVGRGVVGAEEPPSRVAKEGRHASKGLGSSVVILVDQHNTGLFYGVSSVI